MKTNNVFQIDFDAVEKEVRRYEQHQSAILNIEPRQSEQWFDANPTAFTKQQRDTTTVLFGGLTLMQDAFIQAACEGMGYKFKALDCPDNAAMQIGKEFGNRGQCNPTYFTVGNLVKYLIHLRDKEGIDTQTIIDNYIFSTAGACGPCRFGLYVTEYRKALRDAGFEGFRVILFESTGSVHQGGEDMGLDFNMAFFRSLFKAIILGDVINLMAYRMRPYEQNKGQTDQVLLQCRQLIVDQLLARKNVMPALKAGKKLLDQVPLNRLQVKPKVSVIGEFWAMTTEGDGNYHLQRFLEKEGAEVDIQPVTNWTLYLIWTEIYDIRQQLKLKLGWKKKLALRKNLILLKLANRIMLLWFNRYAKAIGLHDYHLAEMQSLADDSHEFYSNELRGGEGHMEVGKLIQSVKYNKSHLVLSVKPFGCMPSSGVSDGVQALVTGKYPSAHFLAIETSGDGAVNVYSRIQMALFKAREKAQKDMDQVLGTQPIGLVAEALKKQKLGSSWYPQHRCALTAANTVYSLRDKGAVAAD
ncbi:MAG: 2-hydroxyglutaryl-CoA dehydratase [Gammaproteobacteria bacterium]|nr:2-hydroxyglutaryl-CoA dehydratase [Gammaproteobacteria bacterium]